MERSEKPANLATPDITPPSLVSRIKSVANTPLVRVVLLVAGFVGIVLGVRLVGANQGSAQVKFVEFPRPANAVETDADRTPTTTAIFSGKAFDTTARMREVAALGLALSLTAFAEFAEKRVVHPTPDVLVQSLARRKLLPPGIEVENGAPESQLSHFHLHYQASPLRFELLSEPASSVQGPALLFRFPLPPANAGVITYFRSRAENGYQIPNPFSSPEQIVALGWTIEQWQGEVLSLEKSTIEGLREQDQWLRTRK